MMDNERSIRILLPALLLAATLLRLAYAMPHPGPERFYDERFSFQNVHAVLASGALEPANGYYATLGFLPQTLLLAMVEGAGGTIYTTEEDLPARVRPPRVGKLFTPLAYRLCRGLQCLWGGLSLWLVYLLGRRLFSPGVGLLAALILACSPWHIRASAVFKPDIVLLLTGLLALLALCHAVASAPRWRPYLVAGVAIAATLSSKLTGGLVALPLVLATALQGRREPRRILLLAGAGLMSGAVFFLLNPQWPMYPRFLERLSEEYADKAELYGGTRWQIPWRAAQLLLDPNGFGPLFGVAALAGLVLFVPRLRRLRRLTGTDSDPDSRTLQRFVVWSYPLLHVAAYALKTPHFKTNNVLPILPVAALFAAWVAVAFWRWGARRLPSPGAVRGLLVVGVVLYLGLPAVHWVYQRIVPAATDLAFWHLARQRPEKNPLHVALLGDAIPASPWEGWSPARRPRVALFALGSSAAPAATTTGADAVLALGEGEIPGFDPTKPGNELFTPRLFHRRGPTVRLVLHLWDPVGNPEAISLRGPIQPSRARRRGFLPSMPEAQRASLEVWIPGLNRDLAGPPPELTVAGQPLALVWLRRSGEGQIYSTRRIPISVPGTRVEITPAGERGLRQVTLALRRWQPGDTVPMAPPGEPNQKVKAPD
jgi:hypothetical protein